MVWLEYFGVITGLLYLFLEIKQHKAMWVVGFLTSLVYVFVFLSAKIYADMGLQTYYVGISIYGFYQWKADHLLRYAWTRGIYRDEGERRSGDGHRNSCRRGR